MSKPTMDANKVVDIKALIMVALIAVSGYFWNESLKSRERFEQLILSNDKRLTERSVWLRVTDIRLTRIENELGIDPLERVDFD